MKHVISAGKMKTLPRLKFLVLFVLVLVVSCGNNAAKESIDSIEQMTPEEAREELKKRNIEYSEYSFLFNIRDNNVRAVKLFLRAGMSPDAKDTHGILSSSRRGGTAYQYVMTYGPAEIFLAMIEAGADVNAADDRGMTALMHAASISDTKIVGTLVQRGADVNASFAAGWTPLLFAVTGRPIDPAGALTGMLLDTAVGLQAELYGGGLRPKSETPKAQAETEETIKTVKIVLMTGADVNHKMAHGETPLMFAALLGRPVIGKMLLEAGADPAVTNLNGETALAIAEKHQRKDFVQMLHDAGAPDGIEE